MDWWQRFHRLMEKPPEGGADPGGGGDPPKEGEKPEGGSPPAGEGKVSLDVIPEEIRDRPEAEQKLLLQHMVNSLGSRNREVEALKEKLAQLDGRISATPPKPPEPDPHEGKSITDLMLEDSEVALDRYMEKKGYVRAFDSLSGRVDSAEFEMVRRDIDDFDEYEEDIKEILKEGNLAPTRTNVRGAYTMAVGARALAEKEQNKRRGTGGIPPSPPEPPKGDDDPKWKSDLEQEIAAAHGVTDPAEWYKHAPDKPMELKLPT